MRAAFYESDITPPLDGFMPGYPRDRRGLNVLDRLYAKALVVEENGSFVALVCLDCLYPEDGMREFVAKRVHEYTGIPEDSVCVCADHTHRGGPLFGSPAFGCKGDEVYKDLCFRLAADSIILAYQRLAEVEVKFGLEHVEGIAFNRNYVLKSGRYITHGRGRTDIERPLDGTDTELPVLTFEQNGKLLGAVISYACHQDCIPASLPGYSGDYSSILSKKLKEVYGNDFVSLFVLGTCGDINAVNPDASVEMPEDRYRRMGELIAKQAQRAIAKAEPCSGNVGVCTENIKIAKRIIADNQEMKAMLDQLFTLQGEEFHKHLGIMKASNMLYYYATNKEGEKELTVQCLKIGDMLLYALPGENYVHIGKELKKNSPAERNMVITCANNRMGYIPTKEAFSEKSDMYESSVTATSCLIPEAIDILYAKAHELGMKVYGETE